MPYLPPAGNVVNFVRDQAAYSPPPGNHVDFHGYTEASYVLTGNGKLPLAGAMSTYSAPVGLGSGQLTLVGEALTGHGVFIDSYGELYFGGTIDTEVVVPTIVASGQINWDGVIDVYVVVNAICSGEMPWGGGIDLFTRPPRIDVDGFGKLPAFGGGAIALRGENVAGLGKLPLGGGAAVRNGRVGFMLGKLALGGAASVRRGVRADAGGALAFRGEAFAGTESSVLCAVDAVLRFGGSAYLQLRIEDADAADVVFVTDRQENTYVVG